MDSAAMCRHIFEAVFNPFMVGMVLFGFLIVRLFFYGDSKLVRMGLLSVFLWFLILSTGWVS